MIDDKMPLLGDNQTKGNSNQFSTTSRALLSPAQKKERKAFLLAL